MKGDTWKPETQSGVRLAIIPRSITATDLCKHPLPAHLTLIEFIDVRQLSTSFGRAFRVFFT